MSSLPSVSQVLEKLAAKGIVVPLGPVVVGSYGDSPEMSRGLIDLIRSGSKRAGTGLLWAHAHDGDPIPEEGSVEIVIDRAGEPVLVTRVTSVTVLPFHQVSAEYAAIEGEGDGSLEYWREVHWEFFSRECARIAKHPTEDMQVVCTVFELLSVVPSGTPSTSMTEGTPPGQRNPATRADHTGPQGPGLRRG